MMFFLPTVSARLPAIGLATRAKKLVEDVMKPLSRLDRCREERSVPMETRVLEMTPVSYKSSESCVVETWDKSKASCSNGTVFRKEEYLHIQIEARRRRLLLLKPI